MTDQAERYDQVAEGYTRWWAPVLAPAVDQLVDRLGDHVDGGTARVIDVGTGTGQLALGALERWPTLSVVGIDASREMCAVADAEADRRLTPATRARFRTEVAFADRLPFDAATFDLAASSFVLQLVPNRHRALREIHRVLRPGAVFGSVTWRAGGRAFEPDRIFDDLLDELGIESGDPDPRSGDFASAARAANELRRAGFRDVDAADGELEHRYTVEGYIGFMTEFDEVSLIEDLEPDERARLLAGLRDRLARLSGAAMTMRFPIIYATARR
jgi:ubiquinone/menaquinone biosynthesis C-methylase UbiE